MPAACRGSLARVDVGRLARVVRARHVEFVRNDVSDIAATASLLHSLDAEMIVTAASRHTWWRGAVDDVPYGAWLPLQLTLVRDLVRARNESGVASSVVCLPFPDNVGPALAPLGLAPDLGAGNVTETATKLELLAVEKNGVDYGAPG